MVGARRHDARGLRARAWHRLRSAIARRGSDPAPGLCDRDRRRHRDVAGAASPAAAVKFFLGRDPAVTLELTVAFELDDLAGARLMRVPSPSGQARSLKNQSPAR